jgi:hypothetical protein
VGYQNLSRALRSYEDFALMANDAFFFASTAGFQACVKKITPQGVIRGNTVCQ